MVKNWYQRIRNRLKACRSAGGYSLTELAISTSIIALLAVGALTALEKKNQADQITKTEYRLTVIDEAIKSFIRTKHYIPCPALPQLTETDVNFGRSDGLTLNDDVDATSNYNSTTQTCSHNGLDTETGAIPVRTLNLADEYSYDAWGRKFTYRTANGSGNQEDFEDPTFRGDIRIVDLAGTPKTNIDSSPPYNEGAIYVIISHGTNGREVAWRRNYDYPADGSEDPGLAAGIEAQNTRHNAAKTYIQNKPTNVFDDMVVFGMKQNVLQPKVVESPIRVDDLTCENANSVLKTGSASFNNTLSNDDLAEAVYKAAKLVSYMCHNNPPGFRSAYDPSILPSIVTWLDASDRTSLWQDTACNQTIANDGDPIACWKDKSGYGNHAIRTGSGTQPHFQIGGLASQPSAYFDGNDSMRFVSQAGVEALGDTDLFASAEEEFTIFIVGQTQTDGTFFARSNNVPAQRALEISVTTTPTPEFILNLRGPDTEVARAYDLKPFVLAMQWNKTSGRYLYQDNDSPISIGDTDGSLTNQKIVLGGANNGSSDRLTGYVSELIVFDRALHDTHLKGVKSYLANKWNIDDGTGNSYCPTGLVFKKTSMDPHGSCHCPTEGQEVMQSLDSSSACFPDNSAIGKCVTVKKRPVYDPSPVTSNLQLWLDANDCTSITLNDERRVTQWRDRTANQRHATATNDNAPLYRANGINTGGTSRAIIQFDHNNEAYFTIDSDELANNADVSIYAVVTTGDMAERRSIFSSRSENAEGSWQLEFGSDGGSRTNSLGVTGEFSDTNIWVARTEDDVLHPAVPYVFEYIRSTTGQSIYVNGVLQTLTDDNDTGNVFAGNDDTKLIGAGASLVADQMMDGGIGELLIYHTAHNQTSRTIVENYLLNRWGIDQNVPTNPNPGNISTTPSVWMDATVPNSGGMVPSHNATMSFWKDRLTLTQYDAIGSPRYLLDAVNDKPVVECSSSTNAFLVGTTSQLFSSGNASIFAVYSTQTSTSARGIFGTSDSGGNLFGYHTEDDTFGGVILDLDTNSSANTTSSFSGTSTYVVSSMLASAGGQVKVFHNGRWQGAKSTDAGSFAETPFHVGGVYDIDSENTTLRIAEFIAYNATLSALDRSAVEVYLGSKWGIPVSTSGNFGN